METDCINCAGKRSGPYLLAPVIIDVVAVTPSSPIPETLFYDGGCALCHRAVRFVLKHDPTGAAFRFAPLHGETFRSKVPAALRSALPDSLAVLTRDGRLLVRSQAVLHVLRNLGGPWKTAAAFLRWIPRPLADMLYTLVARVRYRVFGRREDVCPVSGVLRSRFDP
jgi:predicted DCC family thiol-disulfide oxidoreductase YuxK